MYSFWAGLSSPAWLRGLPLAQVGKGKVASPRSARACSFGARSLFSKDPQLVLNTTQLLGAGVSLFLRIELLWRPLPPCPQFRRWRLEPSRAHGRAIHPGTPGPPSPGESRIMAIAPLRAHFPETPSRHGCLTIDPLPPLSPEAALLGPGKEPWRGYASYLAPLSTTSSNTHVTHPAVNCIQPTQEQVK